MVYVMTDNDEPTVTCTQCGEDTHWLATFPGGICLDCYRDSVDGHAPLTAESVRRMWGAK